MPTLLTFILAAAAVASSPAAADPDRIYLGPGDASGATTEVIGHDGPYRVLRNITAPSLLAFPADPAKATGQAVVIAPGGGFMMLSVDTEGVLVARRLAARGVSAFVLQYRIEPTPVDETAFHARLMARLGAAARGGAAPQDFPTEPLAAEDARSALAYVRAHARDHHIDPTQVGLLGFSAGAITAADVATHGEARPAFVGLIYGALHGEPGSGAPPAFIATSADDPLLKDAAIPLFQAWRMAGIPAELHLFERGGHGYGLKPQGLTSDHWIDSFEWWLAQRCGSCRP